MNARKLVDFFKTKSGNFVLFCLVIAIVLAFVFGYRTSRQAAIKKTEQAKEKAVARVEQTTKRIQKNTTVFNPPKNEAPKQVTPTTIQEEIPLPITIYSSENARKEISSSYAPYGRLVPCELIITVDSAKIETPIVGVVTEDVWHEGNLIIPAGVEVHGLAQLDRSRERIASNNDWVLVWRNGDENNGCELPLKGIALDMEKDYSTQPSTWEITDGSAGLKGEIIKTDKLAELKLFAAVFLSTASTTLQDTEQTINPITGESTDTAKNTPKNAALAGGAAVIDSYAQQLLQAIQRDGFYVRVPAGKQFYLYVTQTIDTANARRGETLNREAVLSRR